MKKIFILLFVFISSLSLAEENSSVVISAYYPEWGTYQRNYQIADVPGENITHLIYAFAKINADGEVETFDDYAARDKYFPGDSWEELLRGNFKQMKLLKEKYPHLKTLIAIGGWTLSDQFSNIALTQESRQKFAQSAVQFMLEYEFDGIDIDWEYPVSGGVAWGRPEDKRNFTLLMQEIRSELDKQDKEYLLTVASPPGMAMKNYELAEAAQFIDWYHLMAYDYHGSWDSSTNHQSALYSNPNDPSDESVTNNIEYSVSYYLSQGVDAQKIVLGLPLYSRGWSGVSTENNGLFQPAKGLAQGSWEPGMLDYKDLQRRVQNDSSNYLVFRDEISKVSWVYHPNLDGGSFYTYDDRETIEEKIEYIQSHNLRGAMFWEISGDEQEDLDNSLIKIAHDKL